MPLSSRIAGWAGRRRFAGANTACSSTFHCHGINSKIRLKTSNCLITTVVGRGRGRPGSNVSEIEPSKKNRLLHSAVHVLLRSESKVAESRRTGNG